MMNPATRTTVGPYTVTRHLSSRGSSDVYLGTLGGTDGPLVLRVLRADNTASLVVRDRVLRKAELARKFQDESLVRVRDVIRDGREVVVVRPFVDGADLTKVLNGYRSNGEEFPSRGALLILNELLQALTYLQAEAKASGGASEEWLHGGITLRNVFITPDGEIRITGFGFGELGFQPNSVEAWRSRRIGTMSPRWICGGQMEQEEDLFAVGALTYQLLTGNSVYGFSDAESPEELKHRVKHWPGIDVEEIGDRLGSRTIAGIIKRLASPRPGANFASAKEALDALQSLVREPTNAEKHLILRSLLDGTEREVPGRSGQPATETSRHPSAEGGATRTLLENGGGADQETLRGIQTSDLGDEFQQVKKNFGVLKARRSPGKPSPKDRAVERPVLKGDSSVKVDYHPTEQTLEVDSREILKKNGLVGVRRDEIPGVRGPLADARKASGKALPPVSESVGPLAEEDRTLELDSRALFSSKNPNTVLRVKTPSPSRILPENKDSLGGNSDAGDRTPGWDRAVLAEKLPPLRDSLTFRLLMGALGVLFLLLGLLVFLWFRKMDVMRYSEVAAVWDGLQHSHRTLKRWALAF